MDKSQDSSTNNSVSNSLQAASAAADVERIGLGQGKSLPLLMAPPAHSTMPEPVNKSNHHSTINGHIPSFMNQNLTDAEKAGALKRDTLVLAPKEAIQTSGGRGGLELARIVDAKMQNG